MADVSTIEADEPIVRADLLLLEPPQGLESQAKVVQAAQALMGANRWLDAARLWSLARRPPTPARDERIDTLALAQEALCISKEKVQLPAEEAFKRAVAVLESGDLAKTHDQETLGIAGGIYKRYWDTFRQHQHLQQALAYYQRGWDAAGIADDGYTGINAAYVADVLAYIEETNARLVGAPSPSAAQRRRQAHDVRLALVEAATELEARLGGRSQPWWILVTLAEAHFGLAADEGAHYASAEQYLEKALNLSAVADWMVETTARQLGAMARMQEAARPATTGDSRPWQVLDVLVRKVPGLRTELGGKVASRCPAAAFARRSFISASSRGWQSSTCCGTSKCSPVSRAARFSARCITCACVTCSTTNATTRSPGTTTSESSAGSRPSSCAESSRTTSACGWWKAWERTCAC